jgi:hypothetical protein
MGQAGGSLYPVATAKAATVPTIAPNSRRVM